MVVVGSVVWDLELLHGDLGGNVSARFLPKASEGQSVWPPRCS